MDERKVKVFTSEALIEEVKKHEPLWNRTVELYNNRAVVDRGWEAVGEVFGRDKEKMKQKWRNIRDTYQRELKKLRNEDGSLDPYTGKWAYYHKLSFLNEIVLPKMQMKFGYSALNVSQESQNNESDGSEVDGDNDESDSANAFSIKIENSEIPRKSKFGVAKFNARKRRADDFDDPLVEIERHEQPTYIRDFESDVDDDLCFVKSLVPYMKRLNPVKKLIVRNEMQKLLIDQLLCERCRTNGVRDNCSCCS